MKITVTKQSKSLPDLLGSQYPIFVACKNFVCFDFVIENLSSENIYIEKLKPAKPGGGYKLLSKSEVPMLTPNVENLYLCSDGGDCDVRIFTQ